MGRDRLDVSHLLGIYGARTGVLDGLRTGSYICVCPTYGAAMLASELKKGSAPFLILALLDAGPLHGYELSRLLERRSEGIVRFHAASLYPLLYRLEKDGLIDGRWVEKAGLRRRRYRRFSDVC